MQTFSSLFSKPATEFTFAGFAFPRTVAMLPEGCPTARLSRYKNPVCGPYYSARAPLGLGAHVASFYLDSDFMPGLRWSWCDEVEGASIGHTGWFTDDACDDKIRGIVFRLPAGRGFLAGWSMGEGMASEVACEIHETEKEAADAADWFAEDAAEREIEYRNSQESEEDAA